MPEESTMSTTAIILVILALAVVAAAAWYYMSRRRSHELQSRFGPEYERATREYGSQRRAEEALRKREKLMEQIRIKPLSGEERERFSARWHEVQTRFVDDPSGSIHEADGLVTDVMRARGYPMGEFERRAEHLSVDHPHVVQNYRAAHAVAVRHERGEATTEDLRRGLVHYRDLFDELLETHPVGSEGRR
jgi:hypothetical protein